MAKKAEARTDDPMATFTDDELVRLYFYHQGRRDALHDAENDPEVAVLEDEEDTLGPFVEEMRKRGLMPGPFTER